MPKVDTLQTFQASLTAASIVVLNSALKAARENAVPQSLQYARQAVAEDSGDTKRSITTKAYQSGTDIIIEMRAKEAALYLEFGTVKMAAQPFMFKSLKKTQDPMVELLADIGEKVLAGDLNP